MAWPRSHVERVLYLPYVQWEISVEYETDVGGVCERESEKEMITFAQEITPATAWRIDQRGQLGSLWSRQGTA